MITAFFCPDRDALIVIFVQAERGRPSVRRVLRVPLAGADPAGVLRTLDAPFDRCVIVVPRTSITVRTLLLPTEDAEEIRGIAAIQAAKQVPLPKDQIIYDCLTRKSLKPSHSNVLLSIVQRPFVAPLADALVARGRTPEAAVADSEGFANIYEPLKRRLGATTFAVIDFGVTHADLSIISGGALIYTRLVHFAASAFAEEGWEAKFGEEVGFAVASYEQPGPPFTKAVFFGSVPDGAAVARVLQERFHLEAQGPLDESDFVQISPEAGAQITRLKNENISCAKALFVSLRPAGKMDFLPAEMRQKIVATRRRVEWVSVFVVLCVFAAACGASFALKYAAKSARLSVIESRIARIEPQVSDLRRQEARLRLFESRRSVFDSPVRILDQAGLALPASAYLSAAIYEQGRVLQLRGTAASVPDVLDYANKLEASAMFENVKTNYVTQRKTDDREVADFEIECPFESVPRVGA